MGLDMDVACVMLVSVSVRVSPSYLTITSEEPKTKERGQLTNKDKCLVIKLAKSNKQGLSDGSPANKIIWNGLIQI